MEDTNTVSRYAFPYKIKLDASGRVTIMQPESWAGIDSEDDQSVWLDLSQVETFIKDLKLLTEIF